MSHEFDFLDFPLQGSQLIEASAGTGKTFSLALLYVRLVLEHGSTLAAAEPKEARARLMPKDILVVTFTEAAAEELRERVRARLVEAAGCFQAAQPAQADTPLQRLMQDIPETSWSSCAAELQLAAEAMDEASIYTIHGWCNRMLTQYAFETKGLFNRELVTDLQDVLETVVKDYWRTFCYQLSDVDASIWSQCFDTPQALYKALRYLLTSSETTLSYTGKTITPQDFDELLNLLATIASRQDELVKRMADAAPHQQRHTQALDACRAAWRQHGLSQRDYLLSIHGELYAKNYGNKAKYEEELKKIDAWAQGATSKLPNKIKYFATGAFAFKQTSQQPQPECEPFVSTKALNEAAEACAPLEKQINALQKEIQRLLTGEGSKTTPAPLSLNAAIIAHALAWCREEFATRKRQQAQMGFDDLLTELWQALKHDPQLPRTLANAFPVAMIDEFQDTDPVQYGIFDSIYHIRENRPENAIIMIGDPKQAIYSFRGADIHTYLQAKRDTAGADGDTPRHYTLKTNYRSTSAVVDVCNHLFQYADKHENGAFGFRTSQEDPIPYPIVQAAGRQDRFVVNQQDASAMILLPIITQDEGFNSLLSSKAYQRQAAEVAASQVVQWLNSAKQGDTGFIDQENKFTRLLPKDIAILVRDRVQAAAMREALRKRSIASVFLSDRDSVFGSDEARDMLDWLRACAEPHNEQYVRTALATASMGISVAQLAGWRDDDLAWQAEVENFMRFRVCWRSRGVLAMLLMVMDVYAVPARLLGNAMDGGERSLTNLLHLAEWCQQAAVEVRGEQALIRHLSEQIDESADEHVLRLESDADLIKIVTIHKSKGLEYPIVMLPFISSWREIDGKTSTVSLPAATAGRGVSEIAGKNVYEKAWVEADKERLLEDMRLLYVALTRARHHLWLSVSALNKGAGKKPAIHKSAMGYLLNGGSAFARAADVFTAYGELAEQCKNIEWCTQPVEACLDTYTGNQPEQLAPARSADNLGVMHPWWIASYSAISFGATEGNYLAVGLSEEEPEYPVSTNHPEEPQTSQEQTASELIDEAPDETVLRSAGREFIHQFPGGAQWGTFLHGLIEWAAEQQSGGLRGFAAVSADDSLRADHLRRLCQMRGIQPQSEGLIEWLKQFLNMQWQFADAPLGEGFVPPRQLQLASLSPAHLMVEMEFLLSSQSVSAQRLDHMVRAHTLQGASRPAALPSTLNGMLKGFIDCVLMYEGRYYVVDWKSNKLGVDETAYHYEAMQDAILKKRYDLQYVLYLLALHRQLKVRLADYDYDKHIGGAVYVFLRGWQSRSQGLFYDRPSKQIIEALDRLFNGDRLAAQIFSGEL